MKISKREKVLLMILGIILITGCYYKFVYIKQNALVNQLEKEKNQDEQKIMSIKTYTTSISKKQSDIKILNAKIQNVTSELFPNIKQEKVIVDLDSILNSSKLDGYSIAFSDTELQSVEPKKQADKKDVPNPLQNLVDQYNGVNISSSNKANSNNSSNNKNKDAASAQKMTLNINFKGSYANVMDFIKSIESYSKKIIVSNITLAQDATSGVSGTVTLEFYAIPKITDEDKDFFKWDYKNQYGKDNPFDGAVTQPIPGGTIEDIGKSNNEPNYDFVMVAKPINSDLPTVMLGKYKDTEKKTYVYADNAGAENVEIDFIKKDDKYYYKYKTSRNAYPLDFSGDGDEFTPTGSSINFKVYSSIRINDSDLSAVNIKIYNKTDKSVNISIDRDDSTRPRVSISGEGGNIDVKRN